MENNSQVIVNRQNDRILLGKIRATKERCNMMLEEVLEMWVRVPETKVVEQTPWVDDSMTTATHEKSELEETHMPNKGHSYLDLVSRSDDGIGSAREGTGPFIRPEHRSGEPAW